ncbi:PilW family protein [Pedosphaera parvula]|uniref:Prepilin-type N-terminal cleavage/methylation domain-containing protein n=1 Tax=Pedosphaera parvula (strain Ellin514) TaxID=320771 RepID=B9XRJ9_PEDPL|nr:prepilin-type N-terminal cleavage/methylation domain-containing protein [Pedosphaera parvula]EEF57518.1 hypothetical protein Cflav_PD0527 [Pedosphaera parvula Ellin514]
MKLTFHPKHTRTGCRQGCRAFTLAEMMVTAAVFMLLMGGLIYCYIFGLRLQQITRVKLGASDDARNALNHLIGEIRSATWIKIGQGDITNFTEVGTNSLQLGNAIQVYPTNDTSIWIRYFYQDSANASNYTKLLRTSYTNNGNYTLVLAHAVITNTVPIFTAEDSWGNVHSNSSNNQVIGMTLQFSQLEYPLVNIGPTNYYDSYQLHTRITRRRLY